ncbi:unnamed protein product [Schistosoma rodhaini]|uniref:MIR domain-containing protein n=1 Tax=Schistosoma rodhaini TaxID=6188 RepID=A0AA85FD26_9TREM|nr:unnamed protein product [Schistosoma rodhaini]CAH8532247.1 unnamed protein product [Schistosoma rodhaini]
MFLVFALSFFIVFIKESTSQQGTVTCGSVLKLVNTDFNARLHSHEVQYGSGSGQQSVTAVSDEMDTNSYWQVVERNGSPQCNRGRVIKCGQKIRLMHLSTRKYLHSHHFQSPLSPNYEVSAFSNNGVGDEGDDWQIICDGVYWKQSSNIRLKHISTEGYLHLSGKRYSRPISGQYEVSSTPKLTNAITWTTTEGVYIDPIDFLNKSTYSHDEF